jgi:hypothetical protein
MKQSKTIFALLAAAVFFSAGCKSAPPVIPDGLSPPEFFQRAQEEADNDRWDNALLYYETFLRQYPTTFRTSLPHGTKSPSSVTRKDNTMRQKRFQALLDTYKEFPNPLAVPQWPRVLSEKLLKIIEEKTKPLIAVSGAK